MACYSETYWEYGTNNHSQLESKKTRKCKIWNRRATLSISKIEQEYSVKVGHMGLNGNF